MFVCGGLFGVSASCILSKWCVGHPIIFREGERETEREGTKGFVLGFSISGGRGCGRIGDLTEGFILGSSLCLSPILVSVLRGFGDWFSSAFRQLQFLLQGSKRVRLDGEEINLFLKQNYIFMLITCGSGV